MRPRASDPLRTGPLFAVATLLVVQTACIFPHGAEEERSAAVRRPNGTIVSLRLDLGDDRGSGQYTAGGELLEVRDDGLLLATSSTILFIPSRYLDDPEVRDPESLRSKSRYPYGLDDALLARLMAETGVERIDTLGGDPEPRSSSAPDSTVLRDFLARAREAAEPFHSLENAVAAGYRLLGPSFPGMGEHWIHPGLIVEDRVAPDRPPVLCYARVDEERRLVGLAFAVPLEPDEQPPDYPAGREAWHDHTDHIDEEVLLLSHPGSHHGADGPRLAMFHAWLWVENPDGVLAQNNWRLPFVQAGLDRGGLHPSADAARGLSLHTAGPDYYLELFDAAAAPGPAEKAALSELLEAYARRAARMAEAGSTAADPAGVGHLETLWNDLWTEIETTVQPRTFRALAGLR